MAKPIYLSNVSKVAIHQNPSTKNNVHHSRTKHIDIRHHFIRETVQQGEIEVKHLASTEMLADLLTKALAFPTFSKLRQNIVVPK